MPTNFKITPSGPLALGWISYWNLYPLKVELERLMPGEIEFHRGHPSVVNRWLAEGKVAIAPSSSICLLKYPSNEVALPLGIASTGPVTSVYIGLHHEDLGLLEALRVRHQLLREQFKAAEKRCGYDARRLAANLLKASDALPLWDHDAPVLSFTPASATSNCLARIFYRLWFGEAAYQMNAAEGAATRAAAGSGRKLEILIGDEALARRSQFRAIIDLGDWWHDLTDLPFVFAVWQAGKKTIAPYWRQKIAEAGEIGEARMRVDATEYLKNVNAVDATGRSIDLAAYWKTIQYKLTPQHFRGLALYLAFARHIMPEYATDQAVLNIMRWEQGGALEQFAR